MKRIPESSTLVSFVTSTADNTSPVISADATLEGRMQRVYRLGGVIRGWARLFTLAGGLSSRALPEASSAGCSEFKTSLREAFSSFCSRSHFSGRAAGAWGNSKGGGAIKPTALVLPTKKCHALTPL